MFNEEDEDFDFNISVIDPKTNEIVNFLKKNVRFCIIEHNLINLFLEDSRTYVFINLFEDYKNDKALIIVNNPRIQQRKHRYFDTKSLARRSFISLKRQFLKEPNMILIWEGGKLNYEGLS